MNMRFFFLIVIFTIGITGTLSAQRNEPPVPREAPPQVKTKKEKGRFKANWKLPYPNPYRAAVYSLALPSAGQFYNKRYWKAPIVWGGFVALVISVDFNKTQRERFETAYGLELAGKPHEFTGIVSGSEPLRRRRNLYDKNLQLTYIGFVGLYALTALDAYVDAHLKAFDIDDDLSLSIKPVFNGRNNSGYGIGLFWQPSR